MHAVWCGWGLFAQGSMIGFYTNVSVTFSGSATNSGDLYLYVNADIVYV